MSFTLKKHDSNKNNIREIATKELDRVAGGLNQLSSGTIVFCGQAGQQTTVDWQDSE